MCGNNLSKKKQKAHVLPADSNASARRSRKRKFACRIALQQEEAEADILPADSSASASQIGDAPLRQNSLPCLGWSSSTLDRSADLSSRGHLDERKLNKVSGAAALVAIIVGLHSKHPEVVRFELVKHIPYDGLIPDNGWSRPGHMCTPIPVELHQQLRCIPKYRLLRI